MKVPARKSELVVQGVHMSVQSRPVASLPNLSLDVKLAKLARPSESCEPTKCSSWEKPYKEPEAKTL
jgi:hypothetical protein